MRAPYKHNQRITAVIAAAGAVALITGSIVLGLAGKDAAAEPDASQNQQIETPAPLMAGSALTRAAEDGGKVVNLTLDDGPDPKWTPKALELLEAHDAKATFCLTGPNAQKHRRGRGLDWNVDPGDFNRPGADKIVSAVQEQLKSKGPTILMHDGGGGRSQSVEALEKLLPWLKEQGYGLSFPKVPEAG
ncbi:polysaccharide deacetylase family protein [Streptomyces sp. NPDC002812]|uniref:polysaccharide deacetylase family protein n=1 Tax=Streptomyces sp. NPDC002812 TaxID=3154434 RepID=UPI003323ACA5